MWQTRGTFMPTNDDFAVSFIIPCYNEAPKTVLDTITMLTTTMAGFPQARYEIFVVNDGMSQENLPSFQTPAASWIHHNVNKGYGASLMSGINRSHFDWIGILDADGTYPADHFNRFVEFAKEYDMIVGKRNLTDIEPLKRLPKYALQLVASFIADYKIPDLNSGMRLFKKNIVFKYIKLFPRRFSFTTTLTMICITNFYKVKFIDIPYYKRVGKSRIRPINDTVRFFSLIMRLALYFKPLRFFVPLSGFVFLLAVARGIRDVLEVNHFGGLALVLFFMAFQIFFFGLIAEIISKK
jgi:glycosyltransferase involved in cell wall biosynthesis